MNVPSDTVPGSPDEWLIHAESDLRYARLGKNDGTVLPGQVCFHAQQAAEKAIKASLLLRGIDFPRSHDIRELLEIGRRHGVAVPSLVLAADSLTPYATQTRYPGDAEEITERDMDAAITAAERVIQWVKERASSEQHGGGKGQ